MKLLDDPIVQQMIGILPQKQDSGIYDMIKSPMKAYAFEKSYNQVRNTNLNTATDPIRIFDNRQNDSITNQSVKARFGSDVSQQTVKDLIKSSKKHGVDPTTVLAMAMQESNISKLNPLTDHSVEDIAVPNLDNYDVMKSYVQRYPEGITLQNVTDTNAPIIEKINDSSIANLAKKLKYAKSLGKKSEAEQIQAWNGYGKVTGSYGIEGEIDMNKNPVYGKRVLDLRDNVIRKNPEIMKYIDGMADGGKVEPKFNTTKSIIVGYNKETKEPVFDVAWTNDAKNGIIPIKYSTTKGVVSDPSKIDWLDEFHKKNAVKDSINTSKMADGGIVKGAGTATSDSIPAQLSAGDFIVPAQYADIAIEIGQQYLGWGDGQTAETSDGEISKHLSNGEVRFTADEVQQLSDQGIDLSQLAPDAEGGEGMYTGGSVDEFGNPVDTTEQYLNDYLASVNSEDPLSQQMDMQNAVQPPVNDAPDDQPQYNDRLQFARQMDAENAARVIDPQQPVSNAPGENRITSMFDLINAQQPVEDVDKYKRAQKAALMSGIGQVFGNLAGAVAGRNARVPQLQRDNTIGQLYGIVDQEKQKYAALKRDWSARLGAAKLQDAQMEIANKRYQDAQNKYNTAQQYKEAQDKLTQENKNRDYKLNVGKYNQTEGKNEFDRDYKTADLRIHAAEAQSRIEKNELVKPFFTVSDYSGKQIPMTQNEFYDAFDQAWQASQKTSPTYDPAVGANWVAQDAAYKVSPLEAKKQLVTFYNNIQEQKREARIKSANLNAKPQQNPYTGTTPPPYIVPGTGNQNGTTPAKSAKRNWDKNEIKN